MTSQAVAAEVRTHFQAVEVNLPEIVSLQEAEAADFMVCALASFVTPFTDNLFGPCHDCGERLQWRPNAPKRPRRICMDCMQIQLGRDELAKLRKERR